jgi:hypothetical protein
MSADVAVVPGARLSESVGSFKYIRSHPAFAPEAIPTIVVPRDSAQDDGVIENVPLGFDFDFYGATYDHVQIYTNGLLVFGPRPAPDDSLQHFFSVAGNLNDTTLLPKNVLAFGWSNWDPSLVPVGSAGGISFDYRGTAPHRRFILQFTNIPEHFKPKVGLLMVQLVLTEGTNDITIYTNTMILGSTLDRYTQGLMNADGSASIFDSVTMANGIVSPKNRAFFTTSNPITNDAVRFTPPQPPVVHAPKDTVVLTEGPEVGVQSALGKCDAQVDPGVATANSGAGIKSLVFARSDGPALPLIGRYPRGVTTITWTATDSANVNAQALQLVTVVDKENPVFTSVPESDSVDNDLHLPSAVVATGLPTAVDNCKDVKISSSRSDGAALDAPFMVGHTTITWTASDSSGNSASAKQVITVHDGEAPQFEQPLDLTRNATSPSGAVVTYSLNVIDNVAVTSLMCNRLSGSVFPIGANTVTCTASDAAGNVTTRGFVVNVVDAKTQMLNLIQYIQGLALSNGVSNPLINQVSAAYGDASVAQECKKMGDFLSMTSKKGGNIPSVSIDYMNTAGGRIMNVLGCVNAPDTQSGNKQ